MAHTLGPWYVHVNSIDHKSISIRAKKADLSIDIGLSKNPEDDARLIAAAPELLEACKAGANALRSYQYGNGSPGLAQEIADRLDAIIEKLV